MAELSQCFNQKNLDLMYAIQACHPQSKNFLNLSILKPLIDIYDLQIDALTVETTFANQTLKERISTDIVYKCCFLALISLNCASPALMQVLRTALTTAVNTV